MEAQTFPYIFAISSSLQTLIKQPPFCTFFIPILLNNHRIEPNLPDTNPWPDKGRFLFHLQFIFTSLYLLAEPPASISAAPLRDRAVGELTAQLL